MMCGVRPVLELMMDGADSQFSFQASEDGFDLGQLHVTLPQQGWIFGHHVGAQQIVAVSQFRLPELVAVYFE